MKLLALTLAAFVAAEDDKKEAAKEGSACTMGKDDCGYEKDQKLICAQLDMTGFEATDEQKEKAKKDGMSEADIEKLTDKMKEQFKIDGDKGGCTASANCDGSNKDTKELIDAGAEIKCSAKALAASVVVAMGALATL